MTRKRFNLLVAFSMMVVCAFAQQLSKEEALQSATSFYGTGSTLNSKKKVSKTGKSTVPQFKLVHQGGSPMAPDYYVYNVSGGGFVIVAGDERMEERIPVYSLTGSFDAENLPDPFKEYLDAYSQKVSKTRKSPAVARQLKAKAPTPLAYISGTALLGDITWHQTAPYNDLCPMLEGGRALTGCGATAAAQVLKYFRWPLVGEGSSTNRNNWPLPDTTVDHYKESYDWDLMLPKYHGVASTPEQNKEVARLMFHLGNSVKMLYTLNGSGSSNREVLTALATNFRYSPKMQLANRIAYTDTEWLNLLKREFDHGRPVLYSGSRSTGGGGTAGHLYICDGYDSQNRLHYNYGWEGLDNAFIEDLGGRYGLDNDAIIGMYPNDRIVADEDEAHPQVVMTSPMYSTNYTPNLGTAFKIGVKVANYNAYAYENPLAIGLYKGETRVQIIGQTPADVNLKQITGSEVTIIDINIDNLKIPAGTANGEYTLRLLTKLGNLWVPALCEIEDVARYINVTIANGKATLLYDNIITENEYGDPIEMGNLKLTKPIDVNISRNKAVVKFSVQNMDEFYDYEETDIAVLVCPDNSPIPTVCARATIGKLASGLAQDFTVEDVPVAPGSDVKSCKYYIAYSPKTWQPRPGREFTFVPMTSYANNFFSYEIPQERVLLDKAFIKIPGGPAPAAPTLAQGYKMYNKEGSTTEKTWWNASLQLAWYAVSSHTGDLLVTPKIPVDDENAVFEWYVRNMYNRTNDYILYVSTDGQEFENFVTPIYNKRHYVETPARISLSQYAGKDVYIAFEAPINEAFGLMHYKMLNIKTPKDISVQSVNIAGSALSGQTIPIKFTVKNHSSLNVLKVKASCTIGNETFNEEFNTNIPFNDAEELTFSKQIVAKGAPGDVTPIRICVELDGEEAAQLNNNDGSAQFTIMNFFPKKGLLAFKTTKIGCYGCNLTYSTLDISEQGRPDAVNAVELWRDGSYKAPKEFDYLTASGTTPTFFINGTAYNQSEIITAVRNAPDKLNPPADLYVQANYADASSRLLKVKIQSKFALPLKGDYKLGAIIIENNVRNIDGQISGTAPQGEKLVKNHIPVANIGGRDGSAGKHIQDPNTQTTYEYEFEYLIPEELMNGATSYRNRKDNMQVIGVLYGPNGEILNSALNSYYLKLPETAGLTFVPEAGYSAFKRIYDVEEVTQLNHVSEVNYRATMPTGTTYQFKINKDASWNNRPFKLVVNPKQFEIHIGEELLIPDENGVYTVNADKHHFIEIKEVSADAPMLNKRKTELVLSGTWTTEAFKSTKFTFDDVTGVDMTGITIPANTGDLVLSNPNALIYTQEDANVPASWQNVVKGSKAVSIALKDGYPFYNSKTFEAENISYHRSFPYPGWGSACVPFDVTTLPEGITPEEYTKSIPTGVLFTETSSMKANTPYILNITQAGEKFFAASGVTLQPSDLQKVAKGNYSFEGTYSKMAGSEVEGLYILNFDGAGFRTATISNDIPSFRSYVRYTGSNPSGAKLNINHTEASTKIENVNAGNELTIRYTAGDPELITMKSCRVEIISIDGCVAKVMDLLEGANPVRGLNKGIYIVEGKKIIIQ